MTRLYFVVYIIHLLTDVRWLRSNFWQIFCNTSGVFLRTALYILHSDPLFIFSNDFGIQLNFQFYL